MINERVATMFGAQTFNATHVLFTYKLSLTDRKTNIYISSILYQPFLCQIKMPCSNRAYKASLSENDPRYPARLLNIVTLICIWTKIENDFARV